MTHFSTGIQLQTSEWAYSLMKNAALSLCLSQNEYSTGINIYRKGELVTLSLFVTL